MYNNIPTMYNHITHPLVRSRVILVMYSTTVWVQAPCRRRRRCALQFLGGIHLMLTPPAAARRPAKFPKSCMHGDMQVACMPSLQFEPATAAAVA